MKQAHPRLRKLSLETIRNAPITLSDLQWAIAREHGFESWPRFCRHIQEVTRKSTLLSKFEMAADAIVDGDLGKLKSLLSKNAELVRARSSRAHGAPLIHYVAANGVEDFRQKTPRNIVAITKYLLRAGAEVDAVSQEYGAASTALGLTATSYHPAKAGVQIALLKILLDAGASINGAPGGWNPLVAALHNGRGDAAAYLAEQGARLDLEGAAGVGRLDLVKSYFDRRGRLKVGAAVTQLSHGFLWACEYGRTEVVEFLVRRVPELSTRKVRGETGLHWAAYGGHAETVDTLLNGGAPVNATDERFDGTPLGWALYAWSDPPPEFRRGRYYKVVESLVRAGATVEKSWIESPHRDHPVALKIRSDARMSAALKQSRKGSS